MIAQHAALARALAEELGLPRTVLEALGGAYERGTGGAGPASSPGEQIPLAARIAQLAEFVEVAHRVGGVDAAAALAQRAQRHAVRPGARRAALRTTPRRSSAGSTTSGPGTR